MVHITAVKTILNVTTWTIQKEHATFQTQRKTEKEELSCQKNIIYKLFVMNQVSVNKLQFKVQSHKMMH